MEVLTGTRGNCSDTCIRAKITQEKTLHDWDMLFPTQYDVGVDNNDFTPVSFAQVKRIIQKQIEQSNKKQ
jgi:calcineurin-like phosphoesterase family protein